MGRRTSERAGAAADARIAVSPATWAALERAVARAVGRSGDREIIPVVRTLEGAVRQLLGGKTPHLRRDSATPLAPRALERVRRYFIEEIRAANPSDAQEGIHILVALGRVQHLLDGRSRHTNARDARGTIAAHDGFSVIEEVAHDMRSPLASILFLVDMLSSGRTGPVSAQQLRQLRLIYGASLGLMQLACDLIDSGRIEERFSDERAIPFSIAELLRGVHDIVLPMAEERNVSVITTPCDGDLRVGVATALHRILLNLTSNAIKFTRDGNVMLGARPLDLTRVEFAVQDSGGEIPEAVLKQIFDPFRHEPSRRRTFSSSGLGLSICHKLVAALGSELSVTTSRTAGTRFHFAIDLPLADPGDAGQ